MCPRPRFGRHGNHMHGEGARRGRPLQPQMTTAGHHGGSSSPATAPASTGTPNTRVEAITVHKITVHGAGRRGTRAAAGTADWPGAMRLTGLWAVLLVELVKRCTGDGCSMSVAPVAPEYEAVSGITSCDVCAGGQNAFLAGGIVIFPSSFLSEPTQTVLIWRLFHQVRPQL